MSIFAVLLLTLSAVLHAGWNLLSKKVSPSSAFFLLANAAGCLLLLPMVLFYLPDLPQFPPTIWSLVIITGLFQALYMAGLASAYSHGNITIAYPLLRAIPILLVALLTTVFDQGKALSTVDFVGLTVIFVGCIFIPLQSFRDARLSNIMNLSCLFALFSAMATVGYTIVDSMALKILKDDTLLGLTAIEFSLLYLFFETLSCTAWLLLIVVTSRRRRKMLGECLTFHRSKVAMAGVAMTLTYALVLISMVFVDNVSYVVAFRQLSIPITVLFGVYLLKEPAGLPKFIGTLTILCGIVLVG
jgi:drug/metabolite transporter (DMT)-like permease